eukprot:3940732-Rhodomonas_salina.4
MAGSGNRNRRDGERKEHVSTGRKAGSASHYAQQGHGLASQIKFSALIILGGDFNAALDHDGHRPGLPPLGEERQFRWSAVHSCCRQSVSGPGMGLVQWPTTSSFGSDFHVDRPSWAAIGSGPHPDMPPSELQRCSEFAMRVSHTICCTQDTTTWCQCWHFRVHELGPRAHSSPRSRIVDLTPRCGNPSFEMAEWQKSILHAILTLDIEACR